jgi:hypothetical protein
MTAQTEPTTSTPNTILSQNLWRWLRRIGIVLGLLGIGIISLLMFLGSPGDSLAISTRAPEVVPMGEPFEIVVNVKNTSSDSKALVSIGLEKQLLVQGIEVQATSPRFRKITQGEHWVEYVFSTQFHPPLAVGEEIPLKLTLVAHRAGEFETQLTLWVENEFRAHYVDLYFRVVQE